MDFEKEVITPSQTQPILVDFWAPWCGPCKVIGPALEELEAEQSKWKLVKVNVDEHPDVSQKYGIRGIPDVRLFHLGEEIDRFTGALPKYQIAAWLEQHLPDERLNQLQQILVSDNREKQLASFVEHHSDFQPGVLELAKLIIWRDPNQAKALVTAFRANDKLFQEATAVKDLASLLNCEGSVDLPVAKKLHDSADALRQGDKNRGIELLIEAVMLDKNYEDELPRKAAVAFFLLEGPTSEVTRKFRRRFDMALY